MSIQNVVSATNTDRAPHGIGPSSQAVAFSHYIHLAAQLGIDPHRGALVSGGVNEQAWQCFKNIRAIVDSIGHEMDDIVRITIFVRHITDLDAVDGAFKAFFPRYVPARTAIAVAALPMEALVQIEALVSHAAGTVPGAPQTAPLIKVARNTAAAPTSLLSTQTVAFSHYNNLSAQIGIDPQSRELVAGGIGQQTHQCFQNIRAILDSIGHRMADIVKITIHVRDVLEIDAATAVFTGLFASHRPALTAIAVPALPMQAAVQIEAVVAHGDGTPPQAPEDGRNIVIRARNTAAVPGNAGSHSVAFSHYNHLSAQAPIDPPSGAVVAAGVQAQLRQCLRHIEAVLHSTGHARGDLVKVNIYLMDMADLAEVDAACAEFFPDGVPARRVIGVAGLPGAALVHVDAVAANAEGTPPP